ncbi:RNA 2',3'-cyclic phosphodiesterase [Acidobacteriota bacterium]
MAANMRAFIAIELSPGIKNQLSLFIKRLDKGDRKVKWANESGMHLTLKFLGEISENQKDSITQAMDRAAVHFEPFLLAFSGTGYFPANRKRPRILWCGIEAEDVLKSLHSILEQELEKIGFPREDRDFHPHITLGRVKVPQGLEPIIRVLEDSSGTSFGSKTVDRFVLVKSTLRPTGAEYSNIYEVLLK